MEASDEVTVTLTAAEWNQAMAILAEGPFRIVAPLLAKIQKQAAQAQLATPNGAGDAAPGRDRDGPHVPN